MSKQHINCTWDTQFLTSLLCIMISHAVLITVTIISINIDSTEMIEQKMKR